MRNRILFGIVVGSLLTVFANHAQAQQTRLTGTLTDGAPKAPLTGASIMLRDQLSRTVADANGQFTLPTNRRGPWILVVTMVGYEKQQIPVNDAGQPVTVSLKPLTQLSQDVVVAASRVVVQAYGFPAVGGLYYLSLIFDQNMR